MSEPVLIGTSDAGEVRLDVGALVGSHLGIVANSGGGKSGLLRKVLEATHSHIQHIILDSEDEFYTLRERFDYVIAGGEGGDAPAAPGNAADLARAALTHGFSLICQINDLGRDGAAEFVDRFLAAMISAPRELWRPCLIVIDEAQRFPAETLQQLTEAGRKRGFTAVIATQRLPKLDANVRGDINNWMMGRVGQALDKRHIADQLGMTPTQMRDALDLPTRSFWAFGSAISREPVLFRVGDVETTMLRPGGLRPNTPPPPEALREILSGLKVPEPEVDAERIAAMMAPAPEESAASCAEKAGLHERIAILERQVDAFTIERAVGQQQIDDLIVERDGLRAAIAALNAAVSKVPIAVHDEPRLPLPVAAPVAPVVAPKPALPPKPAKAPQQGPQNDLSGPQRHFLAALSWWACLGHEAPTRAQVAAIAGWKITSGHLKNVSGSLRTAGLIDYPEPGRFRLTDAGIAEAPDADAGLSFRDQLASTLTGPQRLVFDHLAQAGEQSREELARALGWEPTSGHVKNVLGSMRTLQVVDYPAPGRVALTDWVGAAL